MHANPLRMPNRAPYAPDPSKGVLLVDWPLFGELSRALALKVARTYRPDIVIGVATAGVVVQIVAGVEFPTVPPVLFLLLIPAALVCLGRWRWAAIPAVLAGLFLTVGLFLSGESVRLFDTDLTGGAAGSVRLWVQTVAVVVAAVAGAVTTAQRYRGA